jgi:hypothetical protein
MKRQLLFLIATAVGAGAADARFAPLPLDGVTPIPTHCPLVIGFSSYGAGIDGPTMQAVQSLLNRDRAVRSVSRHPWGREGEVTLCANTRARADSGRLFQAIRRLVPARPRGPVTIRTREGLTFEAPARRR